MAHRCIKNLPITGGLHHGHWYLNALFHLLLDLSSVAGPQAANFDMQSVPYPDTIMRVEDVFFFELAG